MNLGCRLGIVVLSGGPGWAGTMDMLEAKVLDHLVSKVRSVRVSSYSPLRVTVVKAEKD